MIRFMEAALELANARLRFAVSIHPVYSRSEIFCEQCAARAGEGVGLIHADNCPVGYVVRYVEHWRALRAQLGELEPGQERLLELTLDSNGWPEALELGQMPAATVVMTHEEATAKAAAESPWRGSLICEEETRG